MATRIAVDAMGGDDAPDVVVDGALQAAQDHSSDLEIVLFGPSEVIETTLGSRAASSGVSVVHAPDVIGMAEPPSQALRQKKNSSIHLGLGALKEGLADAFVSAGNTGAVMAASLHILGRLEGVARPSVVGLFPSVKGKVVVLDVGTNIDCKPEHLAQFARMGAVYANRILGIEAPSVGLLNIGEEPGKGNTLARETYPILEADEHVHFVGNVEGRDILAHAADVVVCDGFVGNVILKLGESVATVLPKMIAREMATLQLEEEQQRLVGRVFQRVREGFNAEEHGGAPLLGVSGNVVIGHGGSSAQAVKNMILAGAQLAKQGIIEALALSIATTA